MSVILKSIEATIHPDGSFHLDQPMEVSVPTKVLVTIAIEEKQPNELTRAAMEEPAEGEGYGSFDDLTAGLNSR